MGAFKTVVILILSLSFIVFIALFGRLPAFRKTPIGFLHRVLLRHIPNVLSKVDNVITGGRISGAVSSTFHYVMYEKHPLVLIFFVALQLLGEILFLPVVYPTLALGPQLTLIPLILAPYYYLYLCATTSSSVPVSPQAIPQPQQRPFSDSDSKSSSPSPSRTPPSPSILHPSHRSALCAYPYDHLLFHPGYFCNTCRHPKPPRSKHCSLCKACIQRQDHHCIWINNCVGRNNHLYFLLLLIATTALLSYGSMLGYEYHTSLLTARFAPASLLRGSRSAKASTWSKQFSWSQLANAYIWSFTASPFVGATTLLMIMCAPLAAGFLIYHIFLLWVGATTNETAKWSEWKEDIEDGLVYRAKMVELKTGGYKDLPGWVEPASEEVDWPPRDIPKWLWKPKTTSETKQKSHGRSKSIDENQYSPVRGRKNSVSSFPSHSSSTSEASYRARYWYIQTQSGEPPTTTLSNGQEVEDTRWTRVTNLREEVDNMYDLGFLGNLWDIVFHRERP